MQLRTARAHSGLGVVGVLVMDLKMLHKSSTFSSFTSGTAKIGSWFSHIGDRRRKTSANSVLKTSKSLQLGESSLACGSFYVGESSQTSRSLQLGEFFFLDEIGVLPAECLALVVVACSLPLLPTSFLLRLL